MEWTAEAVKFYEENAELVREISRNAMRCAVGLKSFDLTPFRISLCQMMAEREYTTAQIEEIRKAEAVELARREKIIVELRRPGIGGGIE